MWTPHHSDDHTAQEPEVNVEQLEPEADAWEAEDSDEDSESGEMEELEIIETEFSSA